jgi:hypothetical protein
MQINGNDVFSGTIVIAVGENAAIQLPTGLVPIDFRTDSGAVRVDFISGTMIFFNMDSPLGAAATPTVTPAGGAPMPLRLALYTIGEGPGSCRVLHYTGG